MRPRLRLLALLLFVVSLQSAGSALAGVPSAALSQVPAVLRVCPYDGISFVVTVRDAGGNPVASSFVQIDFTGCIPDIYYPNLTPTNQCPETIARGASPAAIYGTVSQVTNAAGQATFQIKAGGVCPYAGARVTADGVLLGMRDVASPDQDGSLVAMGSDAAILVSKETAGFYDATADLDGDGDTNNDAGDYAVYDAHAGHGCDAITPSLSHSWGSLKIRYR